MKIQNRYLFLLVCSACLVWASCLSAQDQPGSQDNPAKLLSPKDAKKRNLHHLGPA